MSDSTPHSNHSDAELSEFMQEAMKKHHEKKARSHAGSVWCEHCRDHFPESHYSDEGYHKAGLDYGPTGRDLSLRSAAEWVRDARAIRHVDDAQFDAALDELEKCL